MHRKTVVTTAILLITLAACKTVGVGREVGGYAEVRATIANEMLLDSSQVVVLDVRPYEIYSGPTGHIAGALAVPYESIETKLRELIPYQNSTVIVYGDTTEDGAQAARLLVAAGFRNVVNIEGGLDAWIGGGYRVVNSQ